MWVEYWKRLTGEQILYETFQEVGSEGLLLVSALAAIVTKTHNSPERSVVAQDTFIQGFPPMVTNVAFRTNSSSVERIL